MERIKSNKIILENEIFSGYVYFEYGKIFDITKNDYPYSKEYDFSNLYVSPGFIDIHTHGGNGYSFDGSEDDIVNGCNFHFKHGTTSIVPTISASKLDIMKNAVINIEKAKSNPSLLGNIIGAHMEGPYLSQKQSGAQSIDYITDPIENEYMPLLNECGKYIKRWTYAPENDKDGKFLNSILKYDIAPSMGHTDAKYDDVLYAYNNGCKLVTHVHQR